MTEPLIFITNFADEAVIVPVWLTLVIGLFLAGWRRGAAAWLLVMGGVMLVIVMTKGVVAGFGPVGGIYSPSGHTTTAAVLAGGCWTLMARRPFAGAGLASPRFRMVAALTTAFAVAAVIGLSRILLHDHTTADVLVVVPLGLAGAALLTRVAAAPPAGVRLWPVAMAALAMVVVFHGDHLSAEHTIARAFGHGAQRPAMLEMPASRSSTPA